RAGERQIENWRRVGVEFADHRCAGAGWQLAQYRAERLLDVDVGLIGVIAIDQLDQHGACALARVRRDRVDSGDTRDGIFEWLGYLALDILGRGIWPDHGHGHDAD